MTARKTNQYFQGVYQDKEGRLLDHKRDVLLGLVLDPERNGLAFEDENHKVYERRLRLRHKINERYLHHYGEEKKRLIFFKKDGQIDDITDHIREWFKEWLYGYGFFPSYPCELEGGTVLVVQGNYPTVEEQIEEDDKILAQTKGKTKEQLKNNREQAKRDAAQKAADKVERKKKEKQELFKMRCNPKADPGYQLKGSEATERLKEALQKYATSWSVYDTIGESIAETIFGYMKLLISEDIMCQLHEECRIYVDELMRLEMKLLIKVHQKMFNSVGWKYPKIKPRRKPRQQPIRKPFVIDDKMMNGFEKIFNLGIVTRPSGRLEDIFRDLNYAAYEYNIEDPLAQLNYERLSTTEFLTPLLEDDVDPITAEDYEALREFCIKFSPLRDERAEYEIINANRAAVYKKLAKKQSSSKASED